jgi:hypothetical protein
MFSSFKQNMFGCLEAAEEAHEPQNVCVWLLDAGNDSLRLAAASMMPLNPKHLFVS